MAVASATAESRCFAFLKTYLSCNRTPLTTTRKTNVLIIFVHFIFIETPKEKCQQYSEFLNLTLWIFYECAIETVGVARVFDTRVFAVSLNCARTF